MNNKNQGNSVAVVTGGARGIGLGCAKALSTKGFDIVLIDVLEEDLERSANALSANGVQTESFVADVSLFGYCQKTNISRSVLLKKAVSHTRNRCFRGLAFPS